MSQAINVHNVMKNRIVHRTLTSLFPICQNLPFYFLVCLIYGLFYEYVQKIYISDKGKWRKRSKKMDFFEHNSSYIYQLFVFLPTTETFYDYFCTQVEYSVIAFATHQILSTSIFKISCRGDTQQYFNGINHGLCTCKQHLLL